MLENHRVASTAAQLRTDFHFARSLASSGSQSVRITFGSGPATCYVIHTGAANDCQCTASGKAVCKGTARALRVASFDADGPVSVASNSKSMLIDHQHATVTPTGTMQVRGRQGTVMHLVVNIMGRVRSCSAAGNVPGQPLC